MIVEWRCWGNVVLENEKKGYWRISQHFFCPLLICRLFPSTFWKKLCSQKWLTGSSFLGLFCLNLSSAFKVSWKCILMIPHFIGLSACLNISWFWFVPQGQSSPRTSWAQGRFKKGNWGPFFLLPSLTSYHTKNRQPLSKPDIIMTGHRNWGHYLITISQVSKREESKEIGRRDDYREAVGVLRREDGKEQMGGRREDLGKEGACRREDHKDRVI